MAAVVRLWRLKAMRELGSWGGGGRSEEDSFSEGEHVENVQ